ncbi:UNVERIFIED_CONTAM: hypothetical protein FKN15_000832 [Acipenser sinensis]
MSSTAHSRKNSPCPAQLTLASRNAHRFSRAAITVPAAATLIPAHTLAPENQSSAQCV